MVVIKTVFLTILFSGLVSLNGTGFSPCSEPGAAATLCDGGAARSWIISNSLLRCLGPTVTASWFTARKGTAAHIALLVSLCAGGGVGQAQPSWLPAGGGCEV